MLIHPKDQKRLLNYQYPKTFKKQLTNWGKQLEKIISNSPLFSDEIVLETIIFREFVKYPQFDDRGYLKEASQIRLPYSIIEEAHHSGKVEVYFVLPISFQELQEQNTKFSHKRFLSLQRKLIASLQQVVSTLQWEEWEEKIAFRCRFDSNGIYFHDARIMQKNRENAAKKKKKKSCDGKGSS